jgi:Glycosyl hydrolase family 81 C-terminal domain
VPLAAVMLLVAAAFVSASSPGTSQAPSDGSHSLQPVVSNQWYSDILAQFPTQPLFALPAAYQLSDRGLAVSTPSVTKAPSSIQAPFTEDLLIGLDSPLGRPKITGIGDWNVDLSMTGSDGTELRFNLAHGVPFTVLHPSRPRLVARCAVGCTVFADNSTPIPAGVSVTTRALSLLVGDRTYLLVLDRSIPVLFAGNTLRLDGASRVFVATLDSRNSFGLFKSTADSEVLDTRAVAKVGAGKVITTYTVRTSGAVPLLALYPHQAQFLAAPLRVLGQYSTIRGSLTLVRATSFTTALTLQPPAVGFDPLMVVPADLVTSLKSDIDGFIRAGPPASQDYFLGVWLGRGTDLLQLAQSTGSLDDARRLLRYLEPLLATGLSGFEYDASRTSMIAKIPEFGNENLNDHHFHYGYYIRAAAVLSLADPGFLTQVRARVALLVDDIASRDRSSGLFPYLRTLDVYEGHSWADGYAKFADGNDEESSSEAINAWYAVDLWSRVTHDAGLEETALYLYATEVQSAKEYWFGTGGLLTPPYQHRLASLVWGGKVDFATWFSAEPNAIYGIQLLPITPGSQYLGQLSGIDAYVADLEAAGGSVDGYWGDLLLAWLSYYAPHEALAKAPGVASSQLNGPRSLLLYTIYRNLQLHPSGR